MISRKNETKILFFSFLLLFFFSNFPLLFFVSSIPCKDDLGDLLAIFEALRKTIVEYGEFPFWNPWCHGGVPLLANSGASFFSIEMLCVLIFGTFYGLRVAVFLYGLLAAFGTYLFLGDYTKNPYARFYGGCIFSMAGCFSLHVINGHFIFLGFAYLPLLFWFVRRIGKPQWYFAAGAGFVAGMLLNHDIHYTSLFSLTAASVMGLPVLFHHYKDRLFWRNVLLAAAMTFAIGGYRMLVSADFMLDYPRKLEIPVIIPLKNLFLALVHPFQDPHWLVHPLNTSKICWNWHEMGCYIGAFALFLGFYSFIKKWRWYHFAILLTGVLTLDSASRYLPGYWLRQLPAFSSCWVVIRWRFLLVLFLALAAAVGFTYLIRQKTISKAKLLILMFLSISMLVASQCWTYARAVPHKTKSELLKLPKQRPSGKHFVTMDFTYLHMYACVCHNVGNLSGYEVTLGYNHRARFAHYPYGSEPYFGEFYSPDAKRTYWSPNRIEFYAERPTKVRINSNTGNYWRLNDKPLFPNQRAFEEEGLFLLDIKEPGYYVLTAVPKIHTFALYFSLICALLALGMIFAEIRKKEHA